MGWEYQRLAAALENCRDVPVQARTSGEPGMLTVTPLSLDGNAPPQIAYVPDYQ